MDQAVWRLVDDIETAESAIGYKCHTAAQSYRDDRAVTIKVRLQTFQPLSVSFAFKAFSVPSTGIRTWDITQPHVWLHTRLERVCTYDYRTK